MHWLFTGLGLELFRWLEVVGQRGGAVAGLVRLGVPWPKANMGHV